MKLFTFLFLFASAGLSAQEKPAATDAFLVTGKVRKEKTVTVQYLESLPAKSIPDIVITNHAGVVKGTAKEMTGILLKDILDSTCFAEPNPRKLNEYYITCIASDGFKAVYSWNELLNSPTGDHTFLVTSKQGKPLHEMEERILIATPNDFATGRRYLKGLLKIVISKVE